MIKAIIFDWGNVLEYYDNAGFVEEMASTFHLDKQKFAEKECEHRIRYDTGGFTTKGFLEAMSREFKVRFTRENYFGPFYARYIHPIPEVQALLKRLKKHYRLLMLSNNSEIAHEWLKRELDFYHDFEKVLISYEHKMRKPDPRIYKLLLDGTGLKPEECLFVDDLPPFVEGAKKVEMQTILFQNPKQLEADLKNMGISWD